MTANFTVKVFFYCLPPASPAQTGYPHTVICLGEGPVPNRPTWSGALQLPVLAALSLSASDLTALPVCPAPALSVE